MEVDRFKMFKLNAARLVADKLSFVLPREVDGDSLTPEVMKYLVLPDEEGDTVAHHLARKGHVFLPEGRGIEVLTLPGKNGRRVAHEQARHFNFINWGRDGLRIAEFQDEDGWSVLHEQVKNGIFFDVFRYPDYLLISDKNGWTVAHEFVKQGGYISPKYLQFYGIADDRGVSVARVALNAGGKMALEVLKYPTYWDRWGVTDVIENAMKQNPEVAEKLYYLITNYYTPDDFINEAIEKIDSIFIKVQEEKRKKIGRRP